MRAYSERLSVPVTWWFLSAVSIAMLGAELWAGLGALAALATYAALALACGATLAHATLTSSRHKGLAEEMLKPLIRSWASSGWINVRGVLPPEGARAN